MNLGSATLDFSDEALADLGRQALTIEIDGLRAQVPRLGAEFARACRICLACRGRIVVTGMGKSGHIGGKIAATLASTGTPAFFVNGSFLSGAQPFESFKARIDEQLKKAEEMVKKGTPKAKLYDVLMKTAKAETGGPAPAAAAAAPEAGPVKNVDPGNAPMRGPKDAPLTVVLFSDFQCPFCGRVEPSLTELEKAYPGKVRVFWKNFPLPFHNNAKPAAEAAMAANEQGKFWEMHDILFKNQQNLDAASLEKYAKEIGLDMARFKAAVDSHKFAAQIEADAKQGGSLGVQGTPASFLNGHFINGAQPVDAFKKIADEELAKVAKVRKRIAATIKQP